MAVAHLSEPPLSFVLAGADLRAGDRRTGAASRPTADAEYALCVCACACAGVRACALGRSYEVCAARERPRRWQLT